MKPFIAFLFFIGISYGLYAQYPDTVYQKVSQVQEFTKDSMLVIFKVVDNKRKPVNYIQVRMWDKSENKIYVTNANNNAIVRFKVPPGRKYTIGIENINNYREYTVKYEEGIVGTSFLPYQPSKINETDINDTITQKLPYRPQPTSDRVLVNIKLRTYDEQNLPNEKVFINELDNDKVYVTTTDEYGNAFFLLPIHKKFKVHFIMERDISELDFTRVRNFYVYQVEYPYEGTATIKKRIAERKRYLRERDSLYEEYLKTVPAEGQQNFIYQKERGRKTEKILAAINERAMKEKKELKKDPNFFVKRKREIEAILYRMKDKWTHKIIVTDITGSMSPYMDQVLLWHSMRISDNESNIYYFFNDGDNTPDSKKIIGKTGGIYNTNTSSLDTLFSVMYKGIIAGNGGDGPENDIETLLKASKKKNKKTEIVLIADNYSSVKDISLLYQLNMPVRVIVCGADIGIHEDYLRIAYHTKGSVHTIEKDINMLSRLKQGSIVTYNTLNPQVKKNKFGTAQFLQKNMILQQEKFCETFFLALFFMFFVFKFLMRCLILIFF